MAPQHILVLRFSAAGDVAMTAPVMRNVLLQNPNLRITYLSAPKLEPLFAGIPRLNFVGIELKKYKGLRGLWRLGIYIKSNFVFDALADLHDVLRTKFLRFFLHIKRTAVIDKGRKEKAELTRRKNKRLRPLRSMFERYADVFRALQIPVILDAQAGLSLLPPPAPAGKKMIGVAPFAKHAAKMYPHDLMSAAINLIAADAANEILIFGSAEETVGYAKGFALPNVRAADADGLAGELAQMRGLDVMVSMDSANMHFASLVGIPVVSLWGGTHPFLGFSGWNNRPENMLQVDLPCRPSSVFGNRTCPVHGSNGCMLQILPETVAARVFEIISAVR